MAPFPRTTAARVLRTSIDQSEEHRSRQHPAFRQSSRHVRCYGQDRDLSSSATLEAPRQDGDADYGVLARKTDAYFAADRRPIILFDGICNFCNANVNFVLDNDPEGKLRLAAQQSPAGRALLARCGRAPDDISSVVLVEEDSSHVKSAAVLKIAKYLRLPFPQMATLVTLIPKFVRDVGYDLIANNRYSILGKRNSCRLSDSKAQSRFLQE